MSVRFTQQKGRRLSWFVLPVLTLALGAVADGQPAAAAPVQSVDGDSGSSGVTITIVQWGGDDLVHAQGPSVSDGCTYGLVVGPPGFIPDLSTVGDAPPDAHLAVLTCNGEAIGLTWVGPHNTVDLADAARSAAQAWVQRVPVPQPRIRSNPPRAALVGVPTWFWLDDAPDAVIEDRIEAFGVAVDVRLVASPVTWRFGDGSTTVASAGRPWPEQSDVRHGYTAAVTVTVETSQRLDPAYRIDGSTWLALDTIDLTATATQRVIDAQAVLTG